MHSLIESLSQSYGVCVRSSVFYILALFCSEALFSAPVGNTSFPQILQTGFFFSSESWIDVRAGYEGDFVYDGRMKQKDEGVGRVDRYKQDTNSGTVTFNILDRLDIYGVFGSSQTRADWRFLDLAGGTHNAETGTESGFLWGVGARAILLEWGNTDIGVGGRYEACRYKPTWLTIDGANASVSGAHLRWDAWQINGDISYKIDLFTPYVGIKYLAADTKIGTFSTSIASNGSGKNRFENRIPVGVYVGCTLSTGKYFMLNLEARFVDEEAITVSGDLRF